MLIPLSDLKGFGCPRTRSLPQEQRSPCAGARCAAFVILWHAGDFVVSGGAMNRRNPNFDHRATWRAKESLGVCGLAHVDHEALQREALELHQDRLTATRPQETYLTSGPDSSTTSFF